MGWEGTIRATQAEDRRQQRESRRRQRELERLAKEQAKLDAAAQAALEVSTYENRIQVLLSVHKEQPAVWDWTTSAAGLAPPPPFRRSDRELRAVQQSCVSQAGGQTGLDNLITQARQQDEEDYQRELQEYACALSTLERFRSLAARIRDGDAKAYTEALVELSPLGELSELGSTIHFTVHNSRLMECGLEVNGVEAIPAEVKSLTANGKLSLKPMARPRFNELYQDYVCGCMLRIGREVFALLPVETLLVTAYDTKACYGGRVAILSAALSRSGMRDLDYERLDPSDTIEKFLHRGDFKASRRTNAFAPINPLTLNDLPSSASESLDSTALLARVRTMREELLAQTSKLTPIPTPVMTSNPE
jgi:hypothetical protein